MFIGTANFVSKRAAYNYYRPYNTGASAKENREIVQEKINSGGITIGAPELKEGQTLSVIPGEGRYQIHTK